MSVTQLFPNTSALCAEHHGGNCPDPETCVYRNTDDSLPLSLEPFADFDWRLAEEAAYQRGLRMGHRNARVQYGRGRFVGFILGVLSLGGLLAALWIIDWLAR